MRENAGSARGFASTPSERVYEIMRSRCSDSSVNKWSCLPNCSQRAEMSVTGSLFGTQGLFVILKNTRNTKTKYLVPTAPHEFLDAGVASCSTNGLLLSLHVSYLEPFLRLSQCFLIVRYIDGSGVGGSSLSRRTINKPLHYVSGHKLKECTVEAA